MDERTRQKYFIIIDGIPELMGVAYELDKYIHKDKILANMIKENLRGKHLKERLQNLGVLDFDDKTQVAPMVHKMVNQIVKKNNSLTMIK